MAEAKHLIRDPLTPWNAVPLKIPADNSIKLISICHPSYPDTKNEFFCFRAIDFAAEDVQANAEDDGTLTSGEDITAYNNAAGIHHGTVAFACFLIAGNKPGVLSPTRISSSQELDSLVASLHPHPELWYDSLLKEKLYYYYTGWLLSAPTN
ncbi:hypothetical protein TWF696_007646 [Orbilia brochopaga]|uniref:Uncharacterized protein n=1 Tax=Orbilia brochopaga TaxID=3140254 RepID=A0AAV9UN49_9PEZI